MKDNNPTTSSPAPKPGSSDTSTVDPSKPVGGAKPASVNTTTDDPGVASSFAPGSGARPK